MKDRIVIGIVSGVAHQAATVIRHLQQQDENKRFMFKAVTNIDATRGIKYYTVALSPGHNYVSKKLVECLRLRKETIQLALIDESKLDTRGII